MALNTPTQLTDNKCFFCKKPATHTFGNLYICIADIDGDKCGGPVACKALELTDNKCFFCGKPAIHQTVGGQYICIADIDGDKCGGPVACKALDDGQKL